MKTVIVKLICDQCGKEVTTTETDQITLPEKWYKGYEIQVVNNITIPDNILKIPNWYQVGYKEQLAGEIVLDFCSDKCLMEFMKTKTLEQVELDEFKKEQVR